MRHKAAGLQAPQTGQGASIVCMLYEAEKLGIAPAFSVSAELSARCNFEKGDLASLFVKEVVVQIIMVIKVIVLFGLAVAHVLESIDLASKVRD